MGKHSGRAVEGWHDISFEHLGYLGSLVSDHKKKHRKTKHGFWVSHIVEWISSILQVILEVDLINKIVKSRQTCTKRRNPNLPRSPRVKERRFLDLDLPRHSFSSWQAFEACKGWEKHSDENKCMDVAYEKWWIMGSCSKCKVGKDLPTCACLKLTKCSDSVQISDTLCWYVLTDV